MDRPPRRARGPAAAALALLAGCAAPERTGVVALSPAPGAIPPSAGVAWTRLVSPFPVLDREGRAYDLPFLGGFDAPRPQLVDIDGDGDDDLFIQEITGRLAFFERVDGGAPGGPAGGAAGEPAGAGARYLWRSDRYQDLDVGEWYRFVDADGDGDLDLFSESPFNYIRYRENVGTPTDPRFVVSMDTLRDHRGAPIFSDRQNIPNAADLDCNGTLDLLIGRISGTITRYEASATGFGPGVTLRHLTDRFEEIEIVADPAGIQPGPAPAPTLPGPFERPRASADGGWGGIRHGANTMAIADPDGDGDPDLLWGDFFEPGLLLIENRGSCERPDLRATPSPFPANAPIRTSGYNAPTFGDVDGDGRLDLLVGVLGGAYNPNLTAADNLLHLARGDDGAWHLRTERFLRQVDVGSESLPVLVDLDGDGRLDLVVGNRTEPAEPSSSGLHLFRNEGGAGPGADPGARPGAGPVGPRFREAGRLSFTGEYHYAPAFGDLDGDGDLDLLLGNWRGELELLRNEGTRSEPAYRPWGADPLLLPRGSNAVPTLGDLDGDGDLDLLVGEASGDVVLFRNDGTPLAPAFAPPEDPYLPAAGIRRAVPRLVDWDGDGDLDLAVGTEAAGILYYGNAGTAREARFAPAPSPFPAAEDLPAYTAPAFGDLDGDGTLELVTGGAGGGLLYYRR